MDRKTSVEHIEKGEGVIGARVVEDATGELVAVDYAGSHAKASPEEIKLVKKLDLWIMVSPLLRFSTSTHAQ